MEVSTLMSTMVNCQRRNGGHGLISLPFIVQTDNEIQGVKNNTVWFEFDIEQHRGTIEYNINGIYTLRRDNIVTYEKTDIMIIVDCGKSKASLIDYTEYLSALESLNEMYDRSKMYRLLRMTDMSSTIEAYEIVDLHIRNLSKAKEVKIA